MQAVKFENKVMLIFTKVLDLRLGITTDDDDPVESTDRAYWEKRGTKQTVELADQVLSELIQPLNPKLGLKYNKFYIGLQEGGQPNNFVSFRPKKSTLSVEVRLDQSDEIQKILDEAGIDLMPFDAKWRRYRLRVTKDDLKKHKDLLADLFQKAYQRSL